MAVAVVSLILVMIPGIGTAVNGSQRWIKIGSITAIQPSEFVKLLVIIFLAGWLARRGDKLRMLWEGFGKFVLILLPLIGFIYFQPDLGTATVISVVAAILYFLAGGPITYLLGLAGAGVAMATPIIFAAGYRASRMESFLDPWKDPQGKGFHIIQSLIALGSGGITGIGFGAGRQKFFYVYGSHTDAIFAIIGEELGLLGTMAVIVLFGTMTYRGLLIAHRCPDRFGSLLASGISCWLAIQAAINIGGITQTIPFTGVPLPFISYGGSSMLVSLMGIGLLMSISRLRVESTAPEEVTEKPKARGAIAGRRLAAES
jgi:cell division protein FtsW